MEILVCVKQVPGSTSVEVDSVTGILKRNGIESKMNPYDLYALEFGIKLAEVTDGHVTAITMGPDQAKEVLKEAVFMGAERGYLISDRHFAGSDVCATSYTLSQGICGYGTYDLILCGKQTTDGDTAQVGPEIAEFLNIPHAANIQEVLESDDSSITVKMNMEHQILIQRMNLPCLLTIDKDVNTPRMPSYKRMLGMDLNCITTLNLSDLQDKNPSHYGLKGSPTQVERIFPPEKRVDREMIEGTGQEQAVALARILRERKVI